MDSGMEYVIFFWGGKQYQGSVGQIVEGEKLPGETGGKHTFDQVLLYRGDKQVLVGDPYLEGVRVEATIVDQKKDKKIRVARYKAKSRRRRVRGHRQLKTSVKIEKILVKKGKK
jgi:large subunit ribosomal protein L21